MPQHLLLETLAESGLELDQHAPWRAELLGADRARWMLLIVLNDDGLRWPAGEIARIAANIEDGKSIGIAAATEALRDAAATQVRMIADGLRSRGVH
ncbi:MAG: hypothetical protein J0H67_07520 [Rhodospirillales bacterium]|nr:hypothetical protein [Rhodospirillales bacterium]